MDIAFSKKELSEKYNEILTILFLILENLDDHEIEFEISSNEFSKFLEESTKFVLDSGFEPIFNEKDEIEGYRIYIGKKRVDTAEIRKRLLTERFEKEDEEFIM